MEGKGHLDAGRKKQSLFDRTVPGSHVLGCSSMSSSQEHRPRGAYLFRGKERVFFGFGGGERERERGEF